MAGSRGKVLTASRTRWLKRFCRQFGRKESKIKMVLMAQCGEVSIKAIG